MFLERKSLEYLDFSFYFELSILTTSLLSALLEDPQ